MAVAMLVDNPKGSREVYEQVRAQLELNKPAGGMVHIAGPSPNGGWRVVELWESPEDGFRFFNERLRPALEAAGAAPDPSVQPQIWQVHNYMT